MITVSKSPFAPLRHFCMTYHFCSQDSFSSPGEYWGDDPTDGTALELSAFSPSAMALLGGSGLRRRASLGGGGAAGAGGGCAEGGDATAHHHSEDHHHAVYAPAAVWKGMIADAVDEDMTGRSPGPGTKW